MTRMMTVGAVVALLLGLAGCGGDSALGVPADAGPPKPVDFTQKFSSTKQSRQTKGARPAVAPSPK